MIDLNTVGETISPALAEYVSHAAIDLDTCTVRVRYMLPTLPDAAIIGCELTVTYFELRGVWEPELYDLRSIDAHGDVMSDVEWCIKPGRLEVRAIEIIAGG